MEDRREEAIALRLAGHSRSQIAAMMGGVSGKSLTKWLRDTPPPSWTRRPRAKDQLREQAVALRLEGKSYRQINEVIGVSKSSLSLWLHDVPLTEEHRRSLQQRRVDAYTRRAQSIRAARVRRTDHIRRRAGEEMGGLTDRELFVAGVVAYWAEGAKAKPWSVSQPVSFMNSDPGLIRLFLRWTAFIGIDDDRLTFRVSIHESADAAAAVRFWSEVVGIDEERFRRTTLKRHNPKTIRKNVGDGYHGCLNVGVLRSTDLNRRISGWCEGIAVGGAASP